MRVAFTLIGGSTWTGGVNYLENLLSAIAEEPTCSIKPILFAGKTSDPKTLARLQPYLAEPPVLSSIWDNSKVIRIMRLVCGLGFQRDYFAEQQFKKANIDVIFQHAAWYGCRFNIPTLAWIADFQHRRLPLMFSKRNFYWRDIGYWALSYCATQLMVSSQDAKRDCITFYPKSVGRVEAVPFAIRMGTEITQSELEEIRKTYNLPLKFYFLPNQFWQHKNHLNVVEALNQLTKVGSEVTIVASGNPKDGRNPEHPRQVIDLIKKYNLEDKFIFLGLIPFQHILPLMRLSVAVINPSFFEGWSTTVEEAKSLGAPMLLSDIPIHREQTDGIASLFNPNNSSDIATVLENEWGKLKSGPRRDAEIICAEKNKQRRKEFALSFEKLVLKTYETN